MGWLVLVWRLVGGDIKRRRAQAALLVLMIATTSTTLALALALRGVSDNPFARTRAATRGPDVVATLVWPEIASFEGVNAVPGPGSFGRFVALTRAPGVARWSGPFPLDAVTLTAGRLSVKVLAEARDRAAASVDRPLLTAGGWVRRGGAVIERGLADALGVHVGDPIRIDGRPFRVAGIALTTATAFYPASAPGTIWLSRADAKRFAPVGRADGYALNLELADPATAPAFVAEHATDPAATLEPWQAIRSSELRVITAERVLLLTATSLLGLFAVAALVVLVGGRMAEQTRRVGLLKAVGATPRSIAMILLAENLLLALIGSLIGLAAGRLIAPVLTHVGHGLLGSPSSAPLTPTSVALVAAVSLAVVGAATVAPAIRGARTSTIRALNDPARPPKRRPRLIALSRRLPVPILLGLRLLARRPRRAIFTAASLAITVAMVVTALAVRSNAQARNDVRGLGVTRHVGHLPGTFMVDRVSHLVFLLSAILILLGALNAIITTWATVIDSERPTALAQALGATPRQISAGLATAQLLPAAAAACLGIPLGQGIYLLLSRNGNTNTPTLWLLAVVPATLIAVAALIAIPARVAARRPLAEVLRSD